MSNDGKPSLRLQIPIKFRKLVKQRRDFVKYSIIYVSRMVCYVNPDCNKVISVSDDQGSPLKWNRLPLNIPNLISYDESIAKKIFIFVSWITFITLLHSYQYRKRFKWRVIPPTLIISSPLAFKVSLKSLRWAMGRDRIYVHKKYERKKFREKEDQWYSRKSNSNTSTPIVLDRMSTVILIKGGWPLDFWHFHVYRIQGRSECAGAAPTIKIDIPDI